MASTGLSEKQDYRTTLALSRAAALLGSATGSTRCATTTAGLAMLVDRSAASKPTRMPDSPILSIFHTRTNYPS
eukprot:3840646-Pleurochrysis_carterae.AAC.2